MSAAWVIRYLIANDAAVLALVPETRIIADVLPIGTALPAIEISEVDSFPYGVIRPQPAVRLHTARVQVSVLAKDTSTDNGATLVEQILQKVLYACPNQYGVINGISVVSIMPDGKGQPLADPSLDFRSRSRDFIVRHYEVPPDDALLNEDGATPILAPANEYILLR